MLKTKNKKQKTKKYKLKPISFYPLKPEKVLSAFMKVNQNENALSSK